jgi:hypothetical protein
MWSITPCARSLPQPQNPDWRGYRVAVICGVRGNKAAAGRPVGGLGCPQISTTLPLSLDPSYYYMQYGGLGGEKWEGCPIGRREGAHVRPQLDDPPALRLGPVHIVAMYHRSYTLHQIF